MQMVIYKKSQGMSKQKFYTPSYGKKYAQSSSKKNEEESYTTASYKRKADLNFNLIEPEKIKSNPSFSLDKMSTRTLEIAKNNLLPEGKRKEMVKLPSIRTRSTNPEDQDGENTGSKTKGRLLGEGKSYYISSLYRSLKKHETTYMMNLYRQHFYQCIEVLRFGRSIKLPHPKKEYHLSKKNPNFKTVFLDMDQTLIHCDQNSNIYTVKLNFPLQRGGSLQAGVRIRPFCKEFLEKLSQFAEIIIFTASSSSYANVILDHIDPQKKLISHRMFRQHCTLEKGYYLKDLRVVNRRLQDVVLVDNSPYCHILQPQNAIPIVPFYHFAQDRELQSLLQFLKVVVAAEDTRTVILNTYFWDKYINEAGDPRKLFLKYHQKE